MQIINKCQLQIDNNRGVIWVHAPNGQTVLRVCGLGTISKIKKYGDIYTEQIDITIRDKKTYVSHH